MDDEVEKQNIRKIYRISNVVCSHLVLGNGIQNYKKIFHRLNIIDMTDDLHDQYYDMIENDFSLEDKNLKNYTLLVYNNMFDTIVTKLIYHGFHVASIDCALLILEKNIPLRDLYFELHYPYLLNCIVYFSESIPKEIMHELKYMVFKLSGDVCDSYQTKKITHYVTNSSKSSDYEHVVNPTILVIKPEWILDCWINRKNRSHDPYNYNQICEYLLTPFSGIRMCFSGFSDYDTNNYIKLATQFGAIASNTVENNTSIIILKNKSKVKLPYSKDHQFSLVDIKWFWSCILMQMRLSEKKFMKPCKLVAKNVYEFKYHAPVKIYDFDEGHERFPTLAASDSYEFIKQMVDKVKEGNKIQHEGIKSATNKMLNMECEYIIKLNILVGIYKKEIIIKNNYNYGPLLEREFIDYLFGQLDPLYDLHLKLINQIANIQYSSENTLNIVDVIRVNEPMLSKEYRLILHKIPPILKLLEDKLIQNVRFYAFYQLMSLELPCKGLNLFDLFLSIYVHLPCILLSINVIIKYIPEGDRKLDELEYTAQHIKSTIDEGSKKIYSSESLTQLVEVYTSVLNCPSIFVNPGNYCIMDLNAHVIHSQKCCKLYQAKIFVTDQSIEIAKIIFPRAHKKHNKKVKENNNDMNIRYEHLILISCNCVTNIIIINEIINGYQIIGIEYYPRINEAASKIIYLRFMCSDFESLSNFLKYLADLSQNNREDTRITDVIDYKSMSKVFKSISISKKINQIFYRLKYFLNKHLIFKNFKTSGQGLTSV